MAAHQLPSGNSGTRSERSKELVLSKVAGSTDSIDSDFIGFDDGIDDELEAAIEASLGLADLPAHEVEWTVLDDARDTDLFEVINSIEQRLEQLRQTQQQRSELEVRLTERAGELARREDLLHIREEALANEESTIASRVESLAHERARMERERASLMEQLAVLQARREVLSSTDAAERERIDARHAELSAIEEQLGAREAQLQQSHSDLDEARRQLDQTRARIEADRQAMEAHTRRVVEQQHKMEQLRATLEQREQAIAERFEQFEQMQSQMAELNDELKQARDNARLMLEQANAERVRNTQMAQELAARCAALEKDRDRVSGELDKARKQLDKQAVVKPQPAAPIRAVPRKARSRAPATVAVWLGTMAVGAIATLLVVQAGAFVGAGAWLIGIAFVACLIGCMTVGGRMTDPSALPVALFGGTFGLWYPKLSEGVSSALAMAQPDLSWMPSMLAPQLATGIGVAAATLAAAFAVYLVMGNAIVLAQTLFAAFAATLLAMLPDESGFAIAAAMMLWLGVMASAMGRWAMQQPLTSKAVRAA